MQIVQDIVNWTRNTFEPLGLWGLFLLSFIEASFFPVPPDLLIIVLTLTSPKHWLLIAAVAAIGSTCGAAFGYFIGKKGGLPLLKRLVSENRIKKVHNYFDKYEAWAIFIAGFTPLPYKVFTISAGVFYVNFKKFIIASIISRFARFFMVALVVMIYGESMVRLIDRYFVLLLILGILAVIGYYIYHKKLKKHKKKK